MTRLVPERAVDEALQLIIARLCGQVVKPATIGRPGSLAEVAKSLYRERQVRGRFLSGRVDLGEPGWDLLLDLFIAGSEGRQVCVSSACIASGAPATTGLRWIAELEQQGTIFRERDARDRRRAYLRLSGETEAAITAYLNAIRGG
jgi:hypothetical protein